jgi:hypothetical protein
MGWWSPGFLYGFVPPPKVMYPCIAILGNGYNLQNTEEPWMIFEQH